MKKLNKFFAVLVALAMMATLAVSMAFAAPAASSTSLQDSKITKVLDVPAGVPSPAASFDFTVTPTAQPTTAGLTAKKVTIPFTAATGTQTQYAPLASFIGLNDSSKKFNLSQPGEYVFTVSEDDFTAAGVATAPAEGAYYLQDSDPLSTENLAKDTKTYTLRIYVVNHVAGQDEQNPPALEIKSITVEDPTSTGATTDEKKVSPETGFVFNNTYTKVINETEQNGGAFNVEKEVTEAGDKAFGYPITISITIDEATLVDGAYTLTAAGKTWSFSDAVDQETGAKTGLTATQTVNLADGEKAIFTTFPAGATVNVVENVAATNVQNAGDYTGAASGLATGTYAKGGELDVTTAAFTAKGQVKVTNTLAASDITPEGILISNLPYIALALVAIGGLVVYVVIRRRNADEA